MTDASRMRVLALTAILSPAAVPTSAQDACHLPTQPVCQADGPADVKQRHRDWIMTWDKRPGDAPSISAPSS